MSAGESHPFTAGLEAYEREADALFHALKAGDEDARWRFKWVHPSFRGKPVGEVKAEALGLADARLVVARDQHFEDWSDLARFTETIARDGPEARFEKAVEAVISGDVDALRKMLRETPDLVRQRSSRRHRATLLHYIAANGVEGYRQKTPENAVEVARILLEAGAEADALARMYDNECTTMSLLVSSCHPAERGLQAALAETLLDHGAALEGHGSDWQGPLGTALAFGYLDTARALAARGAHADTLPAAAGLGRLDDAVRLLPAADGHARQVALAMAAQHGHAEIVRLLLDAGEDPNRFNPEGYHDHSTPLHQAIASNQPEVVRLLVERGARLDIRDTIYGGTPLGWALHCERPDIAEYLRAQGAPPS
jgi:ankyrin repeat protein